MFGTSCGAPNEPSVHAPSRVVSSPLLSLRASLDVSKWNRPHPTMQSMAATRQSLIISSPRSAALQRRGVCREKQHRVAAVRHSVLDRADGSVAELAEIRDERARAGLMRGVD